MAAKQRVKAVPGLALAADLSVPGIQQLLIALATVNGELDQVTKNLKETLQDLQAFTRVAKGATSVLKAFLG